MGLTIRVHHPLVRTEPTGQGQRRAVAEQSSSEVATCASSPESMIRKPSSGLDALHTVGDFPGWGSAVAIGFYLRTQLVPNTPSLRQTDVRDTHLLTKVPVASPRKEGTLVPRAKVARIAMSAPMAPTCTTPGQVRKVVAEVLPGPEFAAACSGGTPSAIRPTERVLASHAEYLSSIIDQAHVESASSDSHRTATGMSHCPRQPDLWSPQADPQPEREGRSLVASAPWPGRGPRRRARAGGNRSTPVAHRRPPTSFRPARPGPPQSRRLAKGTGSPGVRA
jgi:hypothetical protein